MFTLNSSVIHNVCKCCADYKIQARAQHTAPSLALKPLSLPQPTNHPHNLTNNNNNNKERKEGYYGPCCDCMLVLGVDGWRGCCRGTINHTCCYCWSEIVAKNKVAQIECPTVNASPLLYSPPSRLMMLTLLCPTKPSLRPLSTLAMALRM